MAVSIRYIALTKTVVVFCFLFFSCSGDNEREEEIERFRNEYRDPRLIGKWKNINLQTNKIIESSYKLFKQEGDFIVVNNENDPKSRIVNYFYTKGDYLYTYDPGESFKIGSSINDYKYEISNDTLKVRFKSGGVNFKAVKVSSNSD